MRKLVYYLIAMFLSANVAIAKTDEEPIIVDLHREATQQPIQHHAPENAPINCMFYADQLLFSFTTMTIIGDVCVDVSMIGRGNMISVEGVTLSQNPINIYVEADSAYYVRVVFPNGITYSGEVLTF